MDTSSRTGVSPSLEADIIISQQHFQSPPRPSAIDTVLGNYELHEQIILSLPPSDVLLAAVSSASSYRVVTTSKPIRDYFLVKDFYSDATKRNLTPDSRFLVTDLYQGVLVIRRKHDIEIFAWVSFSKPVLVITSQPDKWVKTVKVWSTECLYGRGTGPGRYLPEWLIYVPCRQDAPLRVTGRLLWREGDRKTLLLEYLNCFYKLPTEEEAEKERVDKTQKRLEV